METLVFFLTHFLSYIHSFLPAWGLAIIVLTFCIRLMLFPLQAFQFLQQRKLKTLQPQLDELAKRHSKDPLKLLQESRSLKAQHGIKGGWMFLGALVQLPIFLGLYRMMSSFHALSGVSFLWIASLSSPDKLFLLPAAVAAISFVQMKLSSANGKSAEPTAALMTKLMPAMSFVFMLAMPSGVVLYYLSSGFFQLTGDLLLRHATR